MIGGVVANDVHDRGRGAARVVQIRQPVGKARPAMQQRRGGLAGDPGVPVGGTGHHAFKQPKDAAHAGHAVERGDEGVPSPEVPGLVETRYRAPLFQRVSAPGIRRRS